MVFERNEDEDLYAAASLDHYPDSYCLGNQELQARYHAVKNDDWPDNYKFAYIRKVWNYVEYNPDDQNNIDDVNVDAKLTIGLTEEKLRTTTRSHGRLSKEDF